MTKKGNCHKNPDHALSKKRLNRIVGQMNAISRMIDEQKYCPEIIQQIRAATSAMRSLEKDILKRHLEGCVYDAMKSDNDREIKAKVDEIIKMWS